MRIFVTGATGVIGRRAVPLLVSAGHQVTAVGRTAEKRAALSAGGATPVEADLFDMGSLVAALAGQEVVINLATHIPPTGRMFLPGAWRENDRIRGIASGNLVAAAMAVGAQRFIQESFAPMYADAGDRWIDESAPVRPAAYNRTTLIAEAAVKRFTQYGGAGIALRFAYFYGPDSGQTVDVIGFIRRGWAPLPGAPDAYYSAVSQDDAGSAVAAALSAPAGIYNVVDDEPLPRREVFDSLAAALDVPPPRLAPPWLTPLFGSVGELLARSLRVSNSKLRSETGWAPRYPSVREGWPAVVRELDRPQFRAHPVPALGSSNGQI